MSLINFSGIASGIDSSSLIKALLDQERTARVKPLQTNIADLEDTNASFSQLKDLLQKLNSSANKFRTISGSAVVKTASSSDETILTGSASNSATNGTYSINVSQLAKNATYSFKTNSSSYSSADSIINSSINNGASSTDRTVAFTIGTGSDQEVVNVALTNTSTLNDLVTSFNNSSTKGTASVVNAGTSASPDYRVVINTDNQGLSKGQISVSVGTEITTAGSGALNNNTTSQATDSTLSISGISGTITRSTNSISDVINGVTLNLQSTGSAVISVGDDSNATVSNVQSFVDAYNDVVNYIAENDLVTRQEDSGEVQNIFGALAGTSLDENILTSLRNAISGSGTTGRTVNVFADLGITTERDGTLKFDSAKLKEAVSNDPEGVRTITQNLGDTLAGVSGTIAQYTRFNGLIDQATSANTSGISGMQSKIADTEKSLSEREASLTAQFARLESLIGQLNSQQQQLSALLPG